MCALRAYINQTLVYLSYYLILKKKKKFNILFNKSAVIDLFLKI